MIPKLFCIRMRMVRPDVQGILDTHCVTASTVSQAVANAKVYADERQKLDPLLQINFDLMHAVWKPISFTEESLAELLADPSQFSDKEKKLS